ncbi:MAG: TrkA C-terminal domain-containing protein, partial [Candidatus Marinimicrobia bacterium]|nr:TrkA C-terminal domain-containing protein [Candidatus Neomarinimicrobiota bacterium]
VPIKESKLREEFDVMIVGIIKSTGESIINPKPDTILNTTDTVLLMGDVVNMDKFKESLPS